LTVLKIGRTLYRRNPKKHLKKKLMNITRTIRTVITPLHDLTRFLVKPKLKKRKRQITSPVRNTPTARNNL
jgi:hypothetical protein